MTLDDPPGAPPRCVGLVPLSVRFRAVSSITRAHVFRQLWDLDALAEDCAAGGVHEFLLTSAPLNLRAGAVGPANALAVK